MIYRKTTFIMGVIMAAGVSASAATYYVSLTGSDANPGTESAPLRTVQRGVDLAQGGDTVRIGPGDFGEAVKTVRGGSEANRITIDGLGGARIKRFTTAHSYVTLQNTTVSGETTQYSSLVYFNRGAHHCVLSNNVVDANLAPKVYGISWNGPISKPFGSGEVGSDNLIVSNTIQRVLAITLINVFGDRNVIHGNVLRDSGQVDFFRLFGRSNVISGNLCYNNYLVEGQGNHPDFIQTFGNNGDGSWGHVIESNTVRDAPGAQITQLEGNMVPQIGEWTFRNNLFIDIGLQASCSIPGVKYFNNVFYRCNYVNKGHALSFGGRSYGGPNDTAQGYNGVVGTNYAHHARVVNNAFLACGDSRITVGWYSFEQYLTNIVADYNYVAKGDFSPVEEDPYQRAVGDAGGWATWGKWWEWHGVNGGDPGFLDAPAADFALRDGALLIGRATCLNGLFTRDIRGLERGTAWDIGAYEFGGGLALPPVARPTGLRILAP